MESIRKVENFEIKAYHKLNYIRNNHSFYLKLHKIHNCRTTKDFILRYLKFKQCKTGIFNENEQENLMKDTFLDCGNNGYFAAIDIFLKKEGFISFCLSMECENKKKIKKMLNPGYLNLIKRFIKKLHIEEEDDDKSDDDYNDSFKYNKLKIYSFKKNKKNDFKLIFASEFGQVIDVKVLKNNIDYDIILQFKSFPLTLYSILDDDVLCIHHHPHRYKWLRNKLLSEQIQINDDNKTDEFDEKNKYELKELITTILSEETSNSDRLKAESNLHIIATDKPQKYLKSIIEIIYNTKNKYDDTLFTYILLKNILKKKYKNSIFFKLNTMEQNKIYQIMLEKLKEQQNKVVIHQIAQCISLLIQYNNNSDEFIKFLINLTCSNIISNRIAGYITIEHLAETKIRSLTSTSLEYIYELKESLKNGLRDKNYNISISALSAVVTALCNDQNNEFSHSYFEKEKEKIIPLLFINLESKGNDELILVQTAQILEKLLIKKPKYLEKYTEILINGIIKLTSSHNLENDTKKVLLDLLFIMIEENKIITLQQLSYKVLPLILQCLQYCDDIEYEKELFQFAHEKLSKCIQIFCVDTIYKYIKAQVIIPGFCENSNVKQTVKALKSLQIIIKIKECINCYKNDKNNILKAIGNALRHNNEHIVYWSLNVINELALNHIFEPKNWIKPLMDWFYNYLTKQRNNKTVIISGLISLHSLLSLNDINFDEIDINFKDIIKFFTNIIEQCHDDQIAEKAINCWSIFVKKHGLQCDINMNEIICYLTSLLTHKFEKNINENYEISIYEMIDDILNNNNNLNNFSVNNQSLHEMIELLLKYNKHKQHNKYPMVYTNILKIIGTIFKYLKNNASIYYDAIFESFVLSNDHDLDENILNIISITIKNKLSNKHNTKIMDILKNIINGLDSHETKVYDVIVDVINMNINYFDEYFKILLSKLNSTEIIDEKLLIFEAIKKSLIKIEMVSKDMINHLLKEIESMIKLLLLQQTNNASNSASIGELIDIIFNKFKVENIEGIYGGHLIETLAPINSNIYSDNAKIFAFDLIQNDKIFNKPKYKYIIQRIIELYMMESNISKQWKQCISVSLQTYWNTFDSQHITKIKTMLFKWMKNASILNEYDLYSSTYKMMQFRNKND